MKRFYCIVCKKVKRVRRWPALLENANAVDPTLRVGACQRHEDRVIVHHTNRKVAR